jgi:hypothetical protein
MYSVIIMGIKVSNPGSSGLGHALAFWKVSMIPETRQEYFELQRLNRII